MVTTYVVPNSDLNLYDLKRLYLYLTMLSSEVRYHPDKYCFEYDLNPDDFEERMQDINVSMFVRGFTTDPIDVIVNCPEEDIFEGRWIKSDDGQEFRIVDN
ncbi:MAG: hypothetical protein IJT54_06685 [Candidatus Methanomethylophilaceae archaeon]|nr:hypothetical protein [Candidatus Methanomethylophilaceae archaeon]